MPIEMSNTLPQLPSTAQFMPMPRRQQEMELPSHIPLMATNWDILFRKVHQPNIRWEICHLRNESWSTFIVKTNL